MSFLTVFKRKELKYIITSEQKKRLLNVMKDFTIPDEYGKTVIKNLYFDTSSYRLIRNSIDKPTYKEKLRLRGYGKVTPKSNVFVELKKKYKGTVYKRRLCLSEESAMKWLNEGIAPKDRSQIFKEIDYFLKFYGDLHPTLFLSYEREAFFAKDGSDLRITFDENILCRQTELSLCSENQGQSILDDNLSLLEIKCSGSIPLWLCDFLSKEKIYKTSFSKYGTAYRNFIFKENNNA